MAFKLIYEVCVKDTNWKIEEKNYFIGLMEMNGKADLSSSKGVGGSDR